MGWGGGGGGCVCGGGSSSSSSRSSSSSSNSKSNRILQEIAVRECVHVCVCQLKSLCQIHLALLLFRLSLLVVLVDTSIPSSRSSTCTRSRSSSGST